MLLLSKSNAAGDKIEGRQLRGASESISRESGAVRWRKDDDSDVACPHAQLSLFVCLCLCVCLSLSRSLARSRSLCLSVSVSVSVSLTLSLSLCEQMRTRRMSGIRRRSRPRRRARRTRTRAGPKAENKTKRNTGRLEIKQKEHGGGVALVTVRGACEVEDELLTAPAGTGFAYYCEALSCLRPRATMKTRPELLLQAPASVFSSRWGCFFLLWLA